MSTRITTQTSTAATGVPSYTAECERRTGGHSLDEITGYDVIATLAVGAVTEIRVIAEGFAPNAYTDALEVARRARVTGEFTYAYVGNVYACGCHQAGRAARTGGCVFIPAP